ncbi:hypothetical protein [Mycobacterium nebraskense]|uniref:hypothetical protein n=1 Tax=Mycobacterium nebraskense TaxID=244292 RepID=UPI0023F1F44B|nr:hypothetical protein [Mycobacterium nebraskense]MBI2693021.1 hypothetical protein [Mycobacterium nebraskense]
MADVSRLDIDPVEAVAITSRAAKARVEASGVEPISSGGNAFDAVVAVALSWAASTDATLTAMLQTRGQALARRASAGLGELANMNTENALDLGSL